MLKHVIFHKKENPVIRLKNQINYGTKIKINPIISSQLL